MLHWVSEESWQKTISPNIGCIVQQPAVKFPASSPLSIIPPSCPIDCPIRHQASWLPAPFKSKERWSLLDMDQTPPSHASQTLVIAASVPLSDDILWDLWAQSFPHSHHYQQIFGAGPVPFCPALPQPQCPLTEIQISPRNAMTKVPSQLPSWGTVFPAIWRRGKVLHWLLRCIGDPWGVRMGKMFPNFSLPCYVMCRNILVCLSG